MDSKATPDAAPEKKSSSAGTWLFAIGLLLLGIAVAFAFSQHEEKVKTENKLALSETNNQNLLVTKTNLTKERDDLTAKADTLTKKLTAAGELEKKLKNDISGLEGNVSTLTENKKELETNIGGLKKKLAAIEKERTKLQAELSKATSSNQALTKTKEENAKKLGSLEEKVAKIEGDLKNQSTTLETLKAERDRLAEGKKVAEDNVVKLTAEAEKLKAANAQAMTKATDLENKIKASGNQKQELDKLKKERDMLIADKKALAEQLSEVAAKLEELTKKKAEADKAAPKGTDNAALKTANDKAAALTAERDELKRRIAEMAKQKTAKAETDTGDLKGLQTNLIEIKKANARISKAFHDMSTKARSLNEQIQQLEKALGEEIEKNTSDNGEATEGLTFSQADRQLIKRVEELQRDLLGPKE
ncbi:hypothetical protein OAF27_01960 [Verrucomicrobiales bacterium]|nr:hypothetical protein [Verrucomicrobiales bacterium]